MRPGSTRGSSPTSTRRRDGIKHPVHDFLFTYYSQRPAALRRWHPGFGVGLADAGRRTRGEGVHRIVPNERPLSSAKQGPLLGTIRLLRAPEVPAVTDRVDPTPPGGDGGAYPTLGCFGLHEWAMVHRTPAPRHDWPLRLGSSGTDQVVEQHRITCSHFDAFRFFTDSARPLNTLQPGRDDRAWYEQPGCLHAGMDLYKHAFRLTPLVASELVADCFELAWDIRELDMRASPYDFSELGFEPVRIETPAGKQEYVAAQRTFADRGAPLRRRLIDECDRLLTAARASTAVGSPSDMRMSRA